MADNKIYIIADEYCSSWFGLNEANIYVLNEDDYSELCNTDPETYLSTNFIPVPLSYLLNKTYETGSEMSETNNVISQHD